MAFDNILSEGGYKFVVSLNGITLAFKHYPIKIDGELIELSTKYTGYKLTADDIDFIKSIGYDESIKNYVFDLNLKRFRTEKIIDSLEGMYCVMSNNDCQKIFTLRSSGCDYAKSDSYGNIKGYKIGLSEPIISIDGGLFFLIDGISDGCLIYREHLLSDIQLNSLDYHSNQDGNFRYNLRQFNGFVSLSHQGAEYDFIKDDNHIFEAFGEQTPTCSVRLLKWTDYSSSIPEPDDPFFAAMEENGQKTIIKESGMFSMPCDFKNDKFIFEDFPINYLVSNLRVTMRLRYLQMFKDGQVNQLYLPYLLNEWSKNKEMTASVLNEEESFGLLYNNCKKFSKSFFTCLIRYSVNKCNDEHLQHSVGYLLDPEKSSFLYTMCRARIDTIDEENNNIWLTIHTKPYSKFNQHIRYGRGINEPHVLSLSLFKKTNGTSPYGISVIPNEFSDIYLKYDKSNHSSFINFIEDKLLDKD